MSASRLPFLLPGLAACLLVVPGNAWSEEAENTEAGREVVLSESLGPEVWRGIPG